MRCSLAPAANSGAQVEHLFRWPLPGPSRMLRTGRTETHSRCRDRVSRSRIAVVLLDHCGAAATSASSRTRVADAVDSLNALALARAGGPLPFKGSSPPTSESRPTPPQGAVLARLRRCAREHIPPLAESQPDGALQALLQCTNLYCAGDRTIREPIDLDKLRACWERMQLKDVADAVGAEALPFASPTSTSRRPSSSCRASRSSRSSPTPTPPSPSRRRPCSGSYGCSTPTA